MITKVLLRKATKKAQNKVAIKRIGVKKEP